jgi:hypothetical protein
LRTEPNSGGLVKRFCLSNWLILIGRRHSSTLSGIDGIAQFFVQFREALLKHLAHPRSRRSNHSQRHHALLNDLLVEKLVFSGLTVMNLLRARISHETYALNLNHVSVIAALLETLWEIYFDLWHNDYEF